MRKTLLVAIGFGSLLLLVLLVLSSRTSTLVLSSPIATNIRYPYLESSNTVKFFTGSRFASYNLSTQKSTAITPIYFLPNVTAVRWSPNRIAFLANNYSDADQLYPVLRSHYLSPDKSYWWSVDIKTGSITLLGTAANSYTVLDVVLTSASNAFVVEGTPEEATKPSQQALFTSAEVGEPQFTTYLDGFHSLVSATSTAVDYVGAKSNQLALEQYSLITRKTTVLQQPVTSQIATDASGLNYIYAVPSGNGNENGEPIGTAYIHNSASTKLMSKFSGFASWQPNGSNWAIYNSTDGKGMYFDSGKKRLFSLKGSEKDFKSSSYRIFGVSSESLYFLGPNNTLYSTANSKKTYPTLQDTSSLQKPIYQSSYYRVYESNKSQYDYFILQQPYAQIATKISDSVAAEGFDPNQMNIQYIQYSTISH